EPLPPQQGLKHSCVETMHASSLPPRAASTTNNVRTQFCVIFFPTCIGAPKGYSRENVWACKRPIRTLFHAF
ncbi:MAG: hypothetical protein J7K30_12830, partial [Deltaproteobacteria bacterium]|nr:hypothetical protein [Deltaproteobacteria bacterium]